MAKKNRLPLAKSPTQEGRPLEYTEEMAERICELVATHEVGIPRLCKMYPELPSENTIQRWRYRVENFRLKYAQAKMKQAELLAEQCLEIADDSSRDIKITESGLETFDGEFAARSRLRVDTRKWLASKLLPKMYGDAKELEEEKEKNEELRQQIASLRLKLDAENKRDY